MKKFFKIILTTLTAIVCALSVTACDLAYPDYNDPTGPAHTCESVCPTCHKCKDKDCQDSACAEKCPGHSGGLVLGGIEGSFVAGGTFITK